MTPTQTQIEAALDRALYSLCCDSYEEQQKVAAELKARNLTADEESKVMGALRLSGVPIAAEVGDNRIRCLITGHLFGTDTWMVGRPCGCGVCQEMLRMQAATIEQCVQVVKSIDLSTTYPELIPTNETVRQKIIAELEKQITFDGDVDAAANKFWATG